MMTRALGWLMSLALGVAMLSGCTAAAQLPPAQLPTAPAAGTLPPAKAAGPAGEPAIIALPNLPSYLYKPDIYSAGIARLEARLDSKGLAVTFKSYPADEADAQGKSLYLSAVETELAAGRPPADAYAMSKRDAGTLRQKGYTLDAGELLRQGAPSLYAKYSALLAPDLAGIPMNIHAKTQPGKTIAVLRGDIDADVDTLDGFFRFLDAQVVGTGNIVMASQSVLVDAWAESKGYYSLTLAQGGYLYAARDDDACTPVPLESIQGFGDFLKQMAGYYSNGALIDDYVQFSVETRKNKKIAGELLTLDYFGVWPGSWFLWLNGNFVAHPLEPHRAGLISQPGYDSVLALPTKGSPAKARAVAQFADWLYSSQDHYDAALYGQSGMDFALQGERFVPLKDGQAQSIVNITGFLDLFFAWPGAYMFYNSDYARLSAYAPPGVEEITEAARAVDKAQPLPISRKTGITGQINADAQQISQKRQSILWNLMTLPPETVNDDNIAAAMDQLKEVNTGTLAAEIRRLLLTASAGG